MGGAGGLDRRLLPVALPPRARRLEAPVERAAVEGLVGDADERLGAGGMVAGEGGDLLLNVEAAFARKG